MRVKLSEKDSECVTLIGTFKRYGGVKGEEFSSSGEGSFKCVTALLIDVSFEDGSYACDHLWFKVKRSSSKNEVRSGAIVQVRGKIVKYFKDNGDVDFGLNGTKALNLIKNGSRPTFVESILDNEGNLRCKFYLEGEGVVWYLITKMRRVQKLQHVYNNIKKCTSVLYLEIKDWELKLLEKILKLDGLDIEESSEDLQLESTMRDFEIELRKRIRKIKKRGVGIYE